MYRYMQASMLRGKPLVRDGECVGLVQHYTRAPHTRLWREGLRVVDGPYVLMPGTAIATFVGGRYPQFGHGNRHAAFFLHYGPFDHEGKPTGIWIMEQSIRLRTIQARYIPRFGFPKLPSGIWQQASDNADAFYVIE